MKKWADLGLKQVTIAYETKNKMLTAKGAVTGTAQDIVGIAPNSHTTFLCLSQEDGKILLIPESSILSIQGEPFLDTQASTAEPVSNKSNSSPAKPQQPQQSNQKQHPKKEKPEKKGTPEPPAVVQAPKVTVINRYERNSHNTQRRKAE